MAQASRSPSWILPDTTKQWAVADQSYRRQALFDHSRARRIGRELFFQRHAMKGTSNLITLVSVSGDRKPYLQIDRVEGLAAVAQTAAVELHPWNCAVGSAGPSGPLCVRSRSGARAAFDRVIEAALELKHRLEKLGLVPFCKTTGGKGLHLVTPFTVEGTTIGWPEAKEIARQICSQMARIRPTDIW